MRDHGPGLPAVVPKAQAWSGYLNTTSLFPLLLADYAPLPEGTVRPGKSVNDMSLAGQHPGHGRRSWDLTEADVDKRAQSRSLGPWGGQPLSKPPDSAEVLRYRADLPAVRDFTTTRARRARLPSARVTDLMIAVAELAANTLVHTSGPGTLTLWVTDDEVICQVQDEGQITDPMAGTTRPAPDASGGGRGLWVVHQVCDRVEIHTGPAGTTVRVHMRRESPGE